MVNQVQTCISISPKYAVSYVVGFIKEDERYEQLTISVYAAQIFVKEIS